MTDPSHAGGVPACHPPQRWPWVLGIAVLATVVVWLLTRPGPEPQAGLPPPTPQVAGVQPIPIGVSPELGEVDAIPASPGALAGCNLLLVTLDTARADRIGCYGNGAIETPILDGLARRGVLFSRAIAPAPTTAASHASILTGLYPHRHGVRTNGLYRLSEAPPTLADILAQDGYATAAMVSAFVLNTRFGFARGFEHYDDEVAGERHARHIIPERTADQTADRAVAWLNQHGRERFFLWVHFFDPHAPYQPPAPYDRDYQDVPYDGELAFADAQLGRLLDAVDELGVTGDTLVVVAGDHGEGLNQHGEPRHGYLLYDSTLHVPLILACGERLGGGLQIGRRACLVDVMPTALSLLGLEAPPSLDGIDLTAPPQGSRPVVAETLHGLMAHGWSSLFAVYDGPNKYIHGPDPELYDLSTDPFEQDNLLSTRQDLAAGLRQRLAAVFGAELDRVSPAAPTERLSAADLAKLEALGYVGLASQDDAPAEVPRPNPKAMLALKYRVDTVLEGVSSRVTLDRAVAELKRIITAHPDFEPAYSSLGDCYRRMGNLQWAETAYRRANQLRPNMPHTLLALARIKTGQQDFDTALALYRQLLALYPDHVEARGELGVTLTALGRFSQAVEPLELAFAVMPTDPGVRAALVKSLRALGRGADAIALFERCLERKPTLVSVRNSLARLLVTEGDHAAAVAALRKGLELSPDHLQVANNLGLILANCPKAEFREPAEAVALMERVCRNTQYSQPQYLLTLSIAYSASGRLDDAIAIAAEAERIAQASGQAGPFSAWLEELRRQRAGGATPQTTTAPAIDAPGGG